MESSDNWSHVKVYFQGDEYFNDLLLGIRQAKKEILIESYILDMDSIGLRVLNELSHAVKRQVKVQLTIDGIGSFNWLPQIEKYCKIHSINLRVFHPIPFRTRITKNLSWKKLRRILLLIRKINRRNHRKYILIDNKWIFTGSMNISQVHTFEFMDKKVWRDTSVRLLTKNEEILSLLKSAFYHAWRTARFKNRLHREARSFYKNSNKILTESLRLNTTALMRFLLLRDLNRRMKLSEKRIWITNAYFVPRQSILRNLRRSAKRGIDVRLCLPAVSDVWFVRWAAKSLYLRLLKSGVKIYEYKPSVLHAKTMFIDNWATIGSHNLNHRSLMHDLEVEVVVQDDSTLSILEKQWQDDILKSKEILLSDFEKLNWINRILARFCYWFRYWI